MFDAGTSVVVKVNTPVFQLTEGQKGKVHTREGAHVIFKFERRKKPLRLHEKDAARYIREA